MSGQAPISSVETFVDDLVEVSKIDGNDHHLLDAVIDKFCEDHFGEGSEREYIAGALLKTGLHSAAEDGLTRSEVLAALSETGNVINPADEYAAVPVVLEERASELAGPETKHLHEGLIGFLAASESGTEVRDIGPSPEPAVLDDPNIIREPGMLNDIPPEDQITPMQTKVLSF